MCIPDVCCIPRRLVRFRLWTSFVIGTLDSRTKRHRGYRAGSENKCLDRATSARPEASSSVQVRRRVMPPNCKFNEIQPTVRANSSTKGAQLSTHACMHITKDLETRTRSHKIPNKTNKTWIVLSCQLLSPVDFICYRHALFTHEAASSSFQVRRRVSCWPSRVQPRRPASFPEQPVPLGHCLLLGVVHRRCLLHELKQRKLVV